MEDSDEEEKWKKEDEIQGNDDDVNIYPQMDFELASNVATWKVQLYAEANFKKLRLCNNKSFKNNSISFRIWWLPTPLFSSLDM